VIASKTLNASLEAIYEKDHARGVDDPCSLVIEESNDGLWTKLRPPQGGLA